MPKLTKRAVDAAKAAAGDYLVWDDELPGFGLRVLPSGRKIYLVQYRMRGERRLWRRKLGVHGPMTPDQARTRALKWLAQVHGGENPAALEDLDKNALTVAALCDRYLDDAGAGKIRTRFGAPKKASTLAIDKGRVARHIKPLLGRKLAKSLTRSEVEDFLVAVETGATSDDRRTGKKGGRAIVTGGAATARRTVELLGGIMTYAVRLGVRADNPVSGIKRGRLEPRQRYLTPDEYKALSKALSDSRAAGENPAAIEALRVLALTGARRSEIVGLRWEEIDRRQQCLRLADSKTGPNVRPIGQAALNVLNGISAVDGNPYVFASERAGDYYRGFPKAVRRVMKRAKLKGVTAHTLRHSFATVAAELGYSELTIAALLGHRSGSVTVRYSHAVDRVITAAADRVAAEIEARMEGKAKESAKVVPLRGRKRAR
jgi:integrase